MEGERDGGGIHMRERGGGMSEREGRECVCFILQLGDAIFFSNTQQLGGIYTAQLRRPLKSFPILRIWTYPKLISHQTAPIYTMLWYKP